MKRSLLPALASAAVLLAACGGSSSSQAVCPSTCANGCNSAGKCLSASVCSMAEKPVGVSIATAAQKLGHHRVGETVSFAVPAGTASITIIEQAVQAPDSVTYRGSALDNTAVPNQVRDPSGKVIYDDSASTTDPTAIENLTAFFASNSPATGTLTIPNTSGGLALAASGLTAGTWSLLVSDYAWECEGSTSTCTGGVDTSVYDVTVITRPLQGGALPTTGTLDVVVWFVTDSADGVPLTAASATSDVDLQRLESSLATILQGAEVGVTLGSVTYRDVPSAVRATYATGVDVDSFGACAPLSQLLRTADSGDALNVFLVSSFTSKSLPAGSEVVGIDGTIPGPATVPGTVASGVAVSVANLRHLRTACSGAPAYGLASGNCGADVTAYIIAHEAGHFLGLYHTVESTGLSFDPLSDTERCPCAACKPSTSRAACGTASSAYQMSVSDCSGATAGCGGGDDLMFYLLDTGSTARLSQQQRQVIHANPLLK